MAYTHRAPARLPCISSTSCPRRRTAGSLSLFHTANLPYYGATVPVTQGFRNFTRTFNALVSHQSSPADQHCIILNACDDDDGNESCVSCTTIQPQVLTQE